MRKCMAALLVLVAAAAAGTGDQGLGIGLAAGNPSGLCFKAWLGEKMAVDGVLGASFWGWGGATVDVAVIHHNFEFWENIFHPDKMKVPLYYGVGGIAGYHFWGNPRYANSYLNLGAYVKIGTAVILEDLPLDFFLEPGLGLFLLPRPNIGGVGKAGVRLWL